MKRRLRHTAVVAASLVPLLAQAHPGHDGPHDFEWDFVHLANHPLATFLGAVVLGAGVWAVWRVMGRPKDRGEPVTSESRR